MTAASDAAGRRAELKASLERGIVVAPGVFDMVSARIADGLGFDALYMTGFGTVASHLGAPDAGLATYTEMVGRVLQMADNLNTPLVADADTGFGGAVNVERTVIGYERAGAAAIQIEDQVFPKRCGHTPGRRVVPVEEMVARIRVAVDARSDPGFLVVARTDARTAHGLDEALRRGEAYARAGADILFVESPESEAEMERIGQAFDVPLVANMVEGGRTPLLPAGRLAELGYRLAIFPVSGLLAAAAALERTYLAIRRTGSSDPVSAELYGFDRFNRMIGFERVWELEARHAARDDPDG